MSVIKYCKDCKYYELKFDEEPCISCNGFVNYEPKPSIIKKCDNCGNMDKYCHKCNNYSEFENKSITKICDNCRHIFNSDYCNPCHDYSGFKDVNVEIKENCSSCKYKETNLYLNPCAHCREHSKYEYKKYELKTNSVPKPYKGVIATPDDYKNDPKTSCSIDYKYIDISIFKNPCKNCHGLSKHELETKEKQKPLFSELYNAIESYNEQQTLEINIYIPKVDIKKCCNNCYYNYLTDLNYPTNSLAKYPCNVCINYKRWILQKKTVNNKNNDIPKKDKIIHCDVCIHNNKCYECQGDKWESVDGKKNDMTKTEFLNKNIDEILWEIYELILKQNKRNDDKYILKRG